MAKLTQADLARLGWREKAQAPQDESPGMIPVQPRIVNRVMVQPQQAFPVETLMLSRENAKLRAEVKALTQQIDKLKNILTQTLMRDQARGELLKKKFTKTPAPARKRTRTPKVEVTEAEVVEESNATEGVRVVTPEVLPAEEPRPEPEDGWQEILATAGEESFDGLDADLGLD